MWLLTYYTWILQTASRTEAIKRKHNTHTEPLLTELLLVQSVVHILASEKFQQSKRLLFNSTSGKKQVSIKQFLHWQLEWLSGEMFWLLGWFGSSKRLTREKRSEISAPHFLRRKLELQMCDYDYDYNCQLLLAFAVALRFNEPNELTLANMKYGGFLAMG